MKEQDIHIGPIWTSPESRSGGLATSTICSLMAHYADGSYRYWSIVEEDNEPSLAVFEKLGFISCERINRHRKFLISIYGSGVSAGN